MTQFPSLIGSPRSLKVAFLTKWDPLDPHWRGGRKGFRVRILPVLNSSAWFVEDGEDIHALFKGPRETEIRQGSGSFEELDAHPL